MKKFQEILERAIKRRGSEEALMSLMPSYLKDSELSKVGDDRFLAEMTRVINQAGFSWRVIQIKWPQFEEAFFNFDIKKLSHLSLEDWDEYTVDKRVVRNWINIKATMQNVGFVMKEAEEHGSFAKFIANWPSSDQIGLLKYLKKNGFRLGGKSGQWFLRFIGKDCFVLTRDVCLALLDSGLDIDSKPATQRDLKLIQNQFNEWHKETKLPYCHLSRIAACSIGPINNP